MTSAMCVVVRATLFSRQSTESSVDSANAAKIAASEETTEAHPQDRSSHRAPTTSAQRVRSSQTLPRALATWSAVQTVSMLQGHVPADFPGTETIATGLPRMENVTHHHKLKL